MRTLPRARGALAASLGLLLLVPPVLLLEQQSRTEASLLAVSEARLASVDGLAASTVGNELAGVADALTDAGRHAETAQAFTRDGGPDLADLQHVLQEVSGAFRNVQVAYAPVKTAYMSEQTLAGLGSPARSRHEQRSVAPVRVVAWNRPSERSRQRALVVRAVRRWQQRHDPGLLPVPHTRGSRPALPRALTGAGLARIVGGRSVACQEPVAQ